MIQQLSRLACAATSEERNLWISTHLGKALRWLLNPQHGETDTRSGPGIVFSPPVVSPLATPRTKWIPRLRTSLRHGTPRIRGRTQGALGVCTSAVPRAVFRRTSAGRREWGRRIPPAGPARARDPACE